MKAKHQISDTYWLCLLLMFTGGFIDCYTYLNRGQVFSYAQTANLLMAALNIAQGNWQNLSRYCIPIFAFGCGLMVAEWVRCTYREHPSIHWRQRIVLANGLLLLLVGLLPGDRWDVLATTATSFISAMQMQSFRKFHGNTYVSTMCTGNFRTATEHLFYSIRDHQPQRRKKAAQYYGILGCFVLGAIGSYFASQALGEQSVFLSSALFFLIFLLMLIQEEK